MVSLSDRQALAAMAQADQQLMRLQLLLDGERLKVSGAAVDGLHGQLLAAISEDDAGRFKAVVGELRERKINPESDWCHDDYMLFLLLLGKEKFRCPLPFMAQVMDVRRKNANPLPRKINEVLAALDREEFGVDGEFGFLKIPFLHLVGKLRVGPAEAKKAIQAMSAHGLFDQMSPFLKLLTIKAYDLVLLERQPLGTETAAQLIEGVEKHAKDLSLRQWWRVVAALPGRFLWALGAAIIGLGLIPVLFGVGKEIVSAYFPTEHRTRPATITVAGFLEPGPDLPAEAVVLAKELARPVGTGKRSVVILVQAAPFSTPTSAFVMEASHPSKPIRNAFAFLQSAKGSKAFTVVPVQRDAGRFRALLPPQPAGQIVSFVLEIEGEARDDAHTIGKGIVLRSLE